MLVQKLPATLRWIALYSALVIGAVAGNRAEADTSSPLRAHLVVTGLANAQISHRTNVAKRTTPPKEETIEPVRIRGILPGEGRFDATFTIKRNKTWTATIMGENGPTVDPVVPLLLQGRFRGTRRDKSYPIAAAVIGSTLRLSLVGKKKGTRGKRVTYSIRLSADGDGLKVARVQRVPGSLLRDTTCGTHAEHDHAATKVASDVTASATYSYIQLATDTDAEWFARFGENSNAEIAAVVNAADTIYKSQLGLAFDIVRQNANTAIHTATDSGDLLETFRDYTNSTGALGTADLYHLFTGKNLDGSTVGLAYVGVLCKSTSSRFGLSQFLVSRSFVENIFAHELGHNAGAPHDSNGSGTIMFPSVSGDPALFSQTSINDIGAHLATFSSCLDARDENAPPSATPAPTSPPTSIPTIAPTSVPDPEQHSLGISVSTDDFTNYRVTGALRTIDGSPLTGQAVTLFISGAEFDSAVTNGRGKYTFRLRSRLKVGQFVTVQTAALSSTVFSDVKTIRGRNLRGNRRRR